MDESLIFGFNLKIARVRQRLTQKQFADKMTAAGIKLSTDAVSKIERGERMVNKDFQRCAAGILKCSVNELTTDPEKSTKSGRKTGSSSKKYSRFDGTGYCRKVVKRSAFYESVKENKK